MEYQQESKGDLIKTLSLTAVFIVIMVGLYLYDQQTHILEQVIRRFN